MANDAKQPDQLGLKTQDGRLRILRKPGPQWMLADDDIYLSARPRLPKISMVPEYD